jgi:hypothetical protein
MVPDCWTASGMQFQAGSEKFVTKPLYDQKGQSVSAVTAADSFLSMSRHSLHSFLVGFHEDQVMEPQHFSAKGR